MALTIYDGFKNEDIVDEKIDEDILRLLGLEDISDIDYETYKSLLTERMIADRMGKQKIPSQESEKLTDEYKRVKRNSGRFKVKKRPIKKDNFTPSRSRTSSRKGQSAPAQKLLPAANTKAEEVEDISTDKKESPSGMKNFLKSVVAPSLSKIESSLKGILNNLTNEKKVDAKASREAANQAKKAKSREREEKNEGLGLGKIGRGISAIAKPFSGLFDVIGKFIMGILGGIAALALVEFLEDPAAFFKKIANGIIDFFNGVIESVFNVIFKPINSFIDSINEALDGFEHNIMNSIISKLGFDKLKLPDIPNVPLLQIPTLAGGGQVTTEGAKVSGMGKDTQLIAAQPGEIVMSKKAVDYYGSDRLLSMNAEGGGTNKPGAGNLLGYEGGGMVIDPNNPMASWLGLSGSSPSTSSLSNPYSSSGLTLPTSTPSLPIPKVDTKPQTPAVPPSKKETKSSSGNYNSLLSFISKGEGGYNSMNQGTQGNSIVGSTGNAKSKVGKDLTSMTIGEVMDRQAYLMNKNNPQVGDYGIFAAGRYQIIPSTLSSILPKSGLSKSDMFNQTNQDILGMALITKKQPRVSSYLEGSGSIEGAMDALANEFASMPDPATGNSKYGSGNRAFHTVEEVRKALIKAKTGRGDISPSSGRSSVNPPSGNGNTSVVGGAPPAGGQQAPTSSSNAGQSSVPIFSPFDTNNDELLVVKSIYNIVG